MHTEHLQNIRWSILLTAWLVAFAVTALIVLALIGLNIMEAEHPSTRATIAAVAFGFFAGGAFTGLKAVQAPILYGVALGLLSLLIAFVLKIVSGALGGFSYGLPADLSVTIVLIQIVSAVLGARLGYRFALRGAV